MLPHHRVAGDPQLPASVTTIPAQGPVAAKAAASPSVAGTVDGFLQILQSLKGPMTGIAPRSAGGAGTDAVLPASRSQATPGQVTGADDARKQASPDGPPYPQANGLAALKDAAAKSASPTLPVLTANSAGAGASAGPTNPAGPALPGMAKDGAGNAVVPLPVVRSAQPPLFPQAVTPNPAPPPASPAPVIAAVAGQAPAKPAPAPAVATPASADQANDAMAPATAPVQATPAVPTAATRGEAANPLPAATQIKAALSPSHAAAPSQASPEAAETAVSAPPTEPTLATTQPSDVAASPAQTTDSASQQPPAASPPPLPPLPTPPTAVAFKDPVTANHVASSDKSTRYKQPAPEDFNLPPATAAAQPATAAPPLPSGTMPAPPEASPSAATSSLLPAARPSGSRSVGSAQPEATPQPVAGAVAASAGAAEKHRDGATEQPAVATSASAAQTAPQDKTATAPPQTFPELAQPGNIPSQPAASLAAYVERKDAPRASAASTPLRATPTDLTAQQEIALPTAPNQPAPAAASAPAASAPTPTSTATSPLATQLAPALLALGQGADGGQQMTLRLHPADLGMVQVRIERSTAGVATVEVTVEKADTMQALLRDQAQLHHTLDQAGVPSVGRTITFTMAPDALLASGGGPSDLGQGSQHGPGNGTAAGTDNSALGSSQNGGGQNSQSSGGQPSDGKGGAPNQGQSAYSGGRRNDADTPPGSPSQAQWLRVGLNITA